MTEKMKLLYAEDDDTSAIIYTEVFRKAGFEVSVARDGDEAWDMYQQGGWDVLLFDMDLPGKDGYELIRLIRERGDVVPILILSSLNHYKALYEGADDYLVKGMHVEEIRARLDKAIEHSRQKTSPKDLTLFRISRKTTFDHVTRMLTIGDKQEKLKATETRVLRLLCLRLNELCPKEELCDNIWGVHNQTKERELARYVSTLRKALAPDESIVIENDFGDGYKMLVY